VEVLLEPAVRAAEHVVIAHERAADDVVRVAAEEGRDADELEDVVLVRALQRLRLRADEVVVGAHGDAQTLLVAAADDALRGGEVERLVVEVRRDVVRAVRVAAEHAEFEALRADRLRVGEDVLEALARERGGHEPNRVVHRLGGARSEPGHLRAPGRTAAHRGHGRRGRAELEEVTSVHGLSFLSKTESRKQLSG